MIIWEYIQRGFKALERGRRFVTHDVWYVGQPGEEIPNGFIIRHIRVAILLVTGFFQDALLLRASALTFATLLSIIPFLAIMLFLMQKFNIGEAVSELISPSTWTVHVHSTLQDPAPVISNPVESAEKNRQVWEQFINLLFQGVAQNKQTAQGEPLANPIKVLMRYAEMGANPRTITFAGLIFIMAAVFGLMMNIESSFNRIWGLRSNRNWYRVINDYLMVLFMLPFMVAIVLSLTAILENASIIRQLGPLAVAIRGVQYVFIWLVFAALYYFVPNTRVKIKYALLAGIVSGTLWSLLSWAYIRFQIGLPGYNLIYSAFAQVPILMMWIFFSWTILLFGAELSFAYQNEYTYAMERYAEGASYAYKESLGLWAMLEICRRFDVGEQGITIAEAAKEWKVPTRLLNDMLTILEKAGLITQSATKPPFYQPARSIDRITMGDVLITIRESGRDLSDIRNTPFFSPLLEGLYGKSRGIMAMSVSEVIEHMQKWKTPKTVTEPAPAPPSQPVSPPPQPPTQIQ